MTFSELRDGLFARARFGIRPGLETIRLILGRLDHPERRFAAVQVAGTNGKGSTAAFLASILREGGYRTGLFTSPHLIDYTERFRINGCDIAGEALIPLAEEVLAVAPQDATFFEITTAMALHWFAQEGVDLAVLEVGMGGRLDATNAISGILSVITPISLDHCRYLGDNLREIAGEKAGIITGSAPVVSSVQHEDALPVIAARCREFGAPLSCCGKEFRAEWRQDGLAYQGLKHSMTGLTPGIPGDYQRENAACALAAAELLADRGYPLGGAALSRGIAAASWPGRMELFSGPPRLLLDGAHNPAGVAALCVSLAKISRERLLLLVGVMGDKDWAGVLSTLLPLADQIITVNVNLPQAVAAAELAAFCSARKDRVIAADSVAQGLATASNQAGKDDLILVTGSLYLVGEVRAALLNRHNYPYQG